MRSILAGVSILVVLAVTPVTFPNDDKQTLTGAQIVEKHLAAVGGKEALAKLKTCVALGRVQKEDEIAPLAVMSEAPNRISAYYQFRDYNMQLIYDGNKAIFRPQISRAGSMLMHKYEDMLSTGTLFNDISLYNILTQGESAGLKFEAKGTKKVRSRQAYAVEVKRGKGTLAQLYFDAESFMWVRTDYGRITITKDMRTFTNAVTSHDEETTIDFYVETSDFRDVNGVKLPFKFEQVVSFPILRQKTIGTLTATITEYRHNVPIDPKMFQ